MLTIIHGDDIALSRRYLYDSKQENKDKEIIQLDGKNIDIQQLILSATTDSLFGQDKLIIIENLFSRQASKTKDEIIKYLKKTKHSHDIIIWEAKAIDKRTLNPLTVFAKIQQASYPPILFKFLDEVGTVPKKQLISDFHQLLKQKEAELIFYMIFRQFRYLILVKDLQQKVTELQSWQVRKFLNQAKYFSLDELITNYRKLLTIDYQIKTGVTPFTLDKLIDIFLISL